MTRILTVDDSKSVRLIVSKHLGEFGFEITEAGDGAQGLARLKEGDADLILLDMDMPVLNGVGMLEQLRAAGDRTPVIMLTAASRQSLISAAVKLGIEGYILKPWKAEELRAKVLKGLRGEGPNHSAAAGSNAELNEPAPLKEGGPEPTSLTEKVKRAALDRIAIDKAPVYASKEITVRCLGLLSSATATSAAQLSACIGEDPILAARVLRVAGGAGPGARAGGRIIEGCVTRMGTEALKRNMEALLKEADLCPPHVRETTVELRRRSLSVGSVARDIAAVLRRSEADVAYLVGLFYNLSQYVLVGLQGEPNASGPAIESSQALSTTHRAIGAALAERWKLPEAVGLSLRSAGDYDTAERDGLTNLVRFADALFRHAQGAQGAGAVEAETMVIVGTSLLGLDPTLVDRLTKAVVEGRDVGR